MSETVGYLSKAWLGAAKEAVAQSAAFAETDDVVVAQTITDGPTGDVSYQLVVSGGAAELRITDFVTPSIGLTQSFATARSLASGESNAQEAFLQGDIKIVGDPQTLIDSAPVFSALETALAELRERTSY